MPLRFVSGTYCEPPALGASTGGDSQTKSLGGDSFGPSPRLEVPFLPLFCSLTSGVGALPSSPFRSGGKPAATAAYYDGPLRCFNRGTTPAADLSAYRFAFGVGGLPCRAWSSPMQFGKHQETPRLDVYEVLAGQSLQSFSRKSIL